MTMLAAVLVERHGRRLGLRRQSPRLRHASGRPCASVLRSHPGRYPRPRDARACARHRPVLRGATKWRRHRWPCSVSSKWQPGDRRSAACARRPGFIRMQDHPPLFPALCFLRSTHRSPLLRHLRALYVTVGPGSAEPKRSSALRPGRCVVEGARRAAPALSPIGWRTPAIERCQRGRRRPRPQTTRNSAAGKSACACVREPTPYPLASHEWAGCTSGAATDGRPRQGPRYRVSLCDRSLLSRHLRTKGKNPQRISSGRAWFGRADRDSSDIIPTLRISLAVTLYAAWRAPARATVSFAYSVTLPTTPDRSACPCPILHALHRLRGLATLMLSTHLCRWHIIPVSTCHDGDDAHLNIQAQPLVQFRAASTEGNRRPTNPSLRLFAPTMLNMFYGGLSSAAPSGA
jgi:hypothetical protein